MHLLQSSTEICWERKHNKCGFFSILEVVLVTSGHYLFVCFVNDTLGFLESAFNVGTNYDAAYNFILMAK